MLVQFVVSLVTITVACSTRYLKTTVKTAPGELHPIPTVRVGTRFEFSGVYNTKSSEKNIAQFVLSNGKRGQTLLLQIRSNFINETVEGNPNYFLVSSWVDGIGWADQAGYGKRYLFPTKLTDNLEISIRVEVTDGHYEITINGVKSPNSMVNNRPTVEYYESKTLTVHNTESFTFNSDVLIYTPIGTLQAKLSRGIHFLEKLKRLFSQKTQCFQFFESRCYAFRNI